MNPQTKYAEQQSQLKNELALLSDKLKKHNKKFKTKPTNWGFNGDMGFVLEKIKEVNQFLQP
jgi:hypothetical protein